MNKFRPFVVVRDINDVLLAVALKLAEADKLRGRFVDPVRLSTAITLIIPSVPLWPAAFLEHGVSMLEDARVTDTNTIDCPAKGGSRSHFFGQTAERITLRPSIRTNHGPVTRVAGSAFFSPFY